MRNTCTTVEAGRGRRIRSLMRTSSADEYTAATSAATDSQRRPSPQITTTMSRGMTNDWGGKPGQLMALMSCAKNGLLMNWMPRVIWTSIGKNGTVLASAVRSANALATAMSVPWNRIVRYVRRGAEAVASRVACWALSLASTIGWAGFGWDI